jgi:hypothetical protein
MSSKLKKIYPLYLVIDCSGSMREAVSFQSTERRIDLAKKFPWAIFELYEESQDLVAHLRVSISIFNKSLTEVLPLSEVTEIPKANFDWEPKETDRTFFANLFQSLRFQIERDRDNISGEFDMHNPAIVIFTDGVASNDEASGENREGRIRAHELLLETKGFNQKIQIVMFGVSTATISFLENYATHKNFAIKADASKGIKEQMEGLVLQLKHTLRKSQLEDQGDLNSWLPEDIGPIDREVDDLWGSLENE